MQSMVQEMPSEDLIRELKMHSPTLTRLNDGFRRVYGDVDILTIYEMEPTASLRKNDFDTWERGGPPVMMVEKDSAILYWSAETRIGLSQDHSRIAKVDRGQNGCYDDICHFLQKSLGSTHKAKIKPKVNARPHSSASPSSSMETSVIGRQLCKAIRKGDSKTARDLIQSAEKGWLAKLGGEPLRLAIKYCPEIVSILLDAGADLSARIDEDGSQAIHVAGDWAKSPDTVQLLLDAGANVNARRDDGMMPLCVAAGYNKKPEIVQVLIDAGTDVNTTDIFGNTPLHCAAQRNTNPDIIEVLLHAGGEVNAPNTFGNTPLHCAAQENNNPGIIQVLINAGASVHAPNTLGNTPLHFAAPWNNNPEVVRALIEANADVNARVNGTNPLGLSVSNDNPNVCRELLLAGAHPNRSIKRGYTALHRAVKYGNKAVVGHLLESGADLQAMSKDGITPEKQNFADSVPFETREKIRELISKATMPPEGRVEIKEPKRKGQRLAGFVDLLHELTTTREDPRNM